jgi:hypothetical protein
MKRRRDTVSPSKLPGMFRSVVKRTVIRRCIVLRNIVIIPLSYDAA